MAGNTTQRHVYLWWSPDGVTMIPVTVDNPFPVTVVSGGGSNASVGSTGSPAPTSATEMGIVDGTGKLQNVSSTNPIPISGAVSVSNLPATQPVSGTVAVSNFPATQPISGAVSFTAPQHVVVDSSSSLPVTGPLTDTQLRATAVPVSGTFFQGTQPVSIATMPSTPVTGTFFQATQPVSGAVSFTAPQHVIVDSGSSVAVTGPLTDTQLRASAVPISASSLPLPSLAATSTLQSTGNTSLANLDVALSTRLKPADTLTGVTTVGTITNPVAVTGTFWQGTQPISGSVSFTAPQHTIVDSSDSSTNISSIATQTTASAVSLAAIDLGIPAALGASLTANSMPVNIASDQIVPVVASNDVFERQSAIFSGLLLEMRLMRTAFQDWSGQPDSRIDLSNDYTRGSATQL